MIQVSYPVGNEPNLWYNNIGIIQHGITENLVSYSIDHMEFAFFITESPPYLEASNNKEKYFVLYSLCPILHNVK
jgi:hypothetical protein